jgi:hypothetical protein
MSIQKQDFYEGAALHLLVRHGQLDEVRYAHPFFLFKNGSAVLLKYTTRNRSPWGFTFSRGEIQSIREASQDGRVFIGLICGSDGVAAFSCDTLLKISGPDTPTVHISCYRKHREHYDIFGPEGGLDHKVPPSRWLRLFTNGGKDEAC